MPREMFGKEYIVKVTNDGECVTMEEIIRCEECKYWYIDDDEETYCRIGDIWKREKDFCSNGERRDRWDR